MLTATDITFRAGARVLLDGISAEFEAGRLHLIIGPNGAGKSTLIKVLSRLLLPHRGSVRYGDADAQSWSDRELARHRAVLSQAIEVAFPIPVSELIMMGRYPHFRGRPSAIDDQICDEVMRYFDVVEFSERSYSTLSGGEQQRVNFARVLTQIWRPIEGFHRYLFLDEPLTFLDIRHQIEFMKKVKEFAHQPDVVVIGVVHDLNLAAKFADRLLLLDDGRILADGSIRDVLTVEHIQTAFQITPLLVTDAASRSVHISFD